MNAHRWRPIVLMLLLTVATPACSRNHVDVAPSSIPTLDATANSGPAPASQESPLQATPKPQGPIASIDFKNHRYPWPASLRGENPRVKQIALHEGRMPEIRGGAQMTSPAGDWGAELEGVSFGDVTGDGVDDALVVINVPVCCHGWGINCVYVYGVQGRHPRLLLAFSDGDRSHAGLKDVYAEGGDLLIELWGRDSIVRHGAAHEETEGQMGACCTDVFTRGRYHWSGSTFTLMSKELRPNPNPGGSL